MLLCYPVTTAPELPPKPGRWAGIILGASVVLWLCALVYAVKQLEAIP